MLIVLKFSLESLERHMLYVISKAVLRVLTKVFIMIFLDVYPDQKTVVCLDVNGWHNWCRMSIPVRYIYQCFGVGLCEIPWTWHLKNKKKVSISPFFCE